MVQLDDTSNKSKTNRKEVQVVNKRHLITIAVVLVLLAQLVAACDSGSPTATPIAPPTATSGTVGAGEPTPALGVETPTVAGAEIPTAAVAAGGETPAAGTPNAGGTIFVADTGFRPNPNGYAFPNYSGQYPQTPGNLTIDDVRKMFGDAAVCGQVEGDTCTPKPDAALWLDQMNKMANGGSCYGFTISALRLYKGLDKPSDFGGSDAYGLKLEGNTALRSDIAFQHTLQKVQPVAGAWQQIVGTNTPAQVLDLIIAQMQAGTDMSALIFFQAGKGGHAVAPYAVEDKGNGLFWVHVWDNNYPGQDKYIEIDRTANTWKYALAALNPSEDTSPWGGDATTFSIGISPLSAHTQTLVCPWCGGSTTGQVRHNTVLGAPGFQLVSWLSEKAALAPEGQTRQVWLNGSGHLLIKDDAGHELGFDNGKLVSTLPGGHFSPDFGGPIFSQQEPSYDLPENTAYDVELDGSSAGSAGADGLSVFGEGTAAEINGVNVDQSTQDHLMLGDGGDKISFKSNETETPDIELATEVNGKAYEFDLKSLDMTNGDELDLTVDAAKGSLDVVDSDKTAGQYDLEVKEVGTDGAHDFKHQAIDIQGGETEDIEFGSWDGTGALPIGIDSGSDGSIDQTITEDSQP